MNNEHFQEKISALTKDIIAGAEDKALAERQVADLLFCQRQKDVIPVELILEESSVVKRYPVTEAIEIVRCKAAIFLHSTCFWVVSKPTLANNGRGGALYEMLDWYCDYMDSRDEYEPGERDTFDAACAAIVNILTLPMDAFTDMDYCLGLATDILKRRTDYYNKLADEAEKGTEETFESVVADAEFKQELEFGAEMLAEAKELSKKKAKKGGERS